MILDQVLSTREASKYMCNTLKQQGVTIQYYSAQTSPSQYLKFDFGVLKSLRISNHRAKSHLKYRYNIGSDIKRYKYDRKSKRFFYPLTNEGIDRCIKQILNDRKDKLNRYGKDTYDSYMIKNQQQNEERRGFWRDAMLVE